MDFQKFFEALADEIERRARPDAIDHLTSAAVGAIEDSGIEQINPLECLSWLSRSRDLPLQSWEFDFGQPAFTVARRDDFRIDILYWMEESCATHDHVTCGAFAALYGDRLHTTYEFEETKTYDDYTVVGDLKKLDTEYMKQGEVRPIEPEGVHDLYWLSRPSVTLVVRCNDHPTNPPTPKQYWAPGVGLVDVSHHSTSLARRKAEAISLLRRISPKKYKDAIREVILKDEPTLAYRAFVDATVAEPEFLDQILESEEAQNDTFLSALKATRAEIVRRSVLGGIAVNNKRLRLLLALAWSSTPATLAESIYAAKHATSLKDELPTLLDELRTVSPAAAAHVENAYA